MKPTIQIDNNLSLIKDSSRYTCSIIIGRNYLSYALSDTANTIIYLLKHYYFEDKVIGKNDFKEILSDPVFLNVNNVNIAIDSLKSTLVPAVYFDENHKDEYFELVHELTDEENIHIQKINGSIVSVFSIKKSTVSFLGTIYHNVKFFDASSCLLSTYPTMLLNDDYYSFFICIKDDTATITIYHTKKLILHQVYAESSITDINYYIANFIALYGIPKAKSHINLHGESSRVPLVYNELIQFYPHVKYCNRITDLQYPDSLFNQPPHYFFNLFSLVSCAS